VDGARLLDGEAASGGMTWRVSPTWMAVAAQLENRPPSTGRMPTSSSPVCTKRLRGLLME